MTDAIELVRKHHQNLVKGTEDDGKVELVMRRWSKYGVLLNVYQCIQNGTFYVVPQIYNNGRWESWCPHQITNDHYDEISQWEKAE